VAERTTECFFIGSPSDEIRAAREAGRPAPTNFFCRDCGKDWAAHYGGMILAEDRSSKGRKKTA
jgi:hypothetical protein